MKPYMYIFLGAFILFGLVKWISRGMDNLLRQEKKMKKKKKMYGFSLFSLLLYYPYIWGKLIH